MEIGKHLGKGLWGLADKALPVVYGVGYVWLVIRVLPEEEYGNFVLVQEIFLVLSGLALAFALQPLLKFAAEHTTRDRDVIGAAMLMNAAFVLIAAAVFLAGGETISSILRSPSLAPLMIYVPVMLLASFLRNFTLTLLQAKFQLTRVFWIDAVHFLGAPFLTWVVSRMHLFSTAQDLLLINTVSLSASSVVGVVLARKVMGMNLRPNPAVLREFWDYGKYSLAASCHTSSIRSLTPLCSPQLRVRFPWRYIVRRRSLCGSTRWLLRSCRCLYFRRHRGWHRVGSVIH
jgi:O-antigen/teichoic acid export membrane protein